MSIRISLKNSISENKIKNFVLFSDQNFKIKALNKIPLAKYSNEINKTINNNQIKDNKFLLFNLNPNQKIFLIKIKDPKKSLENEKLGADFFSYIKANSIFDITFVGQYFYEMISTNQNFLEEFLHGAKLKSYQFKKYISKTKSSLFDIKILIKNKSFVLNKNKRFSSLIEGTNFTKDLVSEPGNVLHPDEYAKRLIKLKKVGLKVNVYDQKKLKKLGMNALLGVGQGSIRGSYLVTIEWNGTNSKRNH